MNKKFLSAILFGALMVTSTGTFVSCKDYDDDIDQINKELTDIKSAIAALQAKVDGGKYVTNVVKNGNGITVTWNDNTTSTIETIKGDKGEDGKNGTVVTIVDGFWAFDGVKSEYPAKGDKGDKGDKGEAGAAGAAAAAGHDAKISEDGHWMVWDAEKGEYAKTEYIAGGATAVAGEHGWTIRMKDEKGNEQSIYIPNSADLVSIESVFDGVQNLDIYYGLVNTAVDWTGAKAVNGKMETGMYPTLEEDLKVMLNPTGVDGTAYKFDFRASDNKELWGLTLKEIEPYAGAKLTRAASESGVWVLPRDIQRVPLNELNERADYVTQFKQNDGSTYAFALNATSKESSNVIKSQYIYTFDPINIGNIKAGDFRIYGADKYNYVWNQEHKPNFTILRQNLATATVHRDLSLSQVIYDYKLEIDKTRMTQVNIDKYGLKITEDGYRFIATKEAAVDNTMYLKVNYILVNGSKASVSFPVKITAKDLVVVDSNIGTINSAFNAVKVTSSNIPALVGKFVYEENTKPFNAAEKLGSSYDEWIDAMYQGLKKAADLGLGNAGKSDFLKESATIVGGDPINNDAKYNHALIKGLLYFDYVDENGNSCIYNVPTNKILEKLAAIKALKVYFVAGTCTKHPVTNVWDVVNQTPVKAPYYTVTGNTNYNGGFAIPLNNAFRVQIGAAKEEQIVGEFNFTFQLKQPEIDKVGILPQDGLFTVWKDEMTAGVKTADLLYSFGAFDANIMKLPLYEAFNMWTGSGLALYTSQNPNAKWYRLSNNNPAGDGIILINQSTPTTGGFPNLSQNLYFGNWTDYITSASNVSASLLNSAITATPQKEARINVDVEYDFFGVYPALKEQLPFYSDAAGTHHPGFRLIFASTVHKSTLKTTDAVLNAKAGTQHVFISNDNVECTTMLNRGFVLFPGLDANGTARNRAYLNSARDFEEAIRPFDIDYVNVTAKYVGNGSRINAIQIPTTTTKFDASVPTDWKITQATGDIEPEFGSRTAPVDGIALYEVDAREGEAPSATNLKGVKAHNAGLIIQLGTNIDNRQPIEVSIPVKDQLGYVKVLKVTLQKLQ